jgi:hypothetical protein
MIGTFVIIKRVFPQININDIEVFWSFTKGRPAKFNGVTKNFKLKLKDINSAGIKNLISFLRND